MFRLETPWALCLLFVCFGLWGWRHWRKKKRQASLVFSGIGSFKNIHKSLRCNMLWICGFLRGLALTLLVIALARPQAGREKMQEITQGVAIEMVLDRSGSMRNEMAFEGRTSNRLETAKEIFKRFVIGNGGVLAGRKNDIIGMVAFARYADTICPMTLGHDVLMEFLKTVKLVEIEAENSTAIGDAIALAAARLHTVETILAKQSEKDPSAYHIKNKVMILLTDGENNAGRRSVLQAGELARQWGIRVYVVMIDSPVHQGFFGFIQQSQVDTTDLEKVASTTGGFFRKASDGKTLQSFYEEIDKLERSKVETTRYMDYREYFVPFALVSLFLLLLEQLLAHTIFRRVP